MSHTGIVCVEVLGVSLLYSKPGLAGTERNILVPHNPDGSHMGGFPILCIVLGAGAYGDLLLYAGATVFR